MIPNGKLPLALVWGIAVAAVFLFARFQTKILDGLENGHHQARFFFRTSAPNQFAVGAGGRLSTRVNDNIDPRLFLVGIDNTSVIKYGRYPWPRSRYAAFFDFFSAGKPLVLYADIFFGERSDPINDTVLSEALKKYKTRNKNLILPFWFFSSYQNSSRSLDEKDVRTYESRLPLLDGFSIPSDGAWRTSAQHAQIMIPLPEIVRNAEFVGDAEITFDSRHVTENCPLFAEYKGRIYPSIVLQMAMRIWNVGLDGLLIQRGKRVVLKNAKIPVLDGYGAVVATNRRDVVIPLQDGFKMIVNYSGYPGEFSRQGAYLSADDVFNGIPPETVNQKIVFFGVTDANMNGDIWQSPFGPMPGVEHLMWALNTILTGRYLTMIRPIWEIVLAVCLALLLSLLIQAIKPGWIIPLMAISVLAVFAGDLTVFLAAGLMLNYWELFLIMVFLFPVQILWRFSRRSLKSEIAQSPGPLPGRSS